MAETSRRANERTRVPNASDESRENSTRTPRMSAPKRKRFRALIFLIKLAVFLLVVLWIILQLKKSWVEILNYNWSPKWEWLFLSGLFYLCGFFPAAILWFLSLRWLGQSPNFFGAIFAYYSSQLGKYVPGKAMVVVIRTGMIASEAVNVGVAAASVFYETLVMMGSGAFIGALIVFFYFRENAFFSWIALVFALCSITPLLPPIFSRILLILKIGKNDANIQRSLKNLKYRTLIIGLALTSILWLFWGLSLWAVIKGVGVDPGSLAKSLPRYIASVSLAMSLGFVVIVSPGGLGIREAILSKLLIPYFTTLLHSPVNVAFTMAPGALATIVSLLQRIISILAELTVFVLLYAYRIWLKPKKRRGNE